MEKRIELKVDNVMVSDKQATMTIVLSATDGVDTVELTGLLFSMMYAVKKIYEETEEPQRALDLDQAEILVIRKLRRALAQLDGKEETKEPQITKVKKGVYRKWTSEEIDRAQTKRRATMLKKKLESTNSEDKPLKKKEE